MDLVPFYKTQHWLYAKKIKYTLIIRALLGIACQRPLEIGWGLSAMFLGIRVCRAYKNKGPSQIRISKYCESTNGIGNV